MAPGCAAITSTIVAIELLSAPVCDTRDRQLQLARRWTRGLPILDAAGPILKRALRASVRENRVTSGGPGATFDDLAKIKSPEFENLLTAEVQRSAELDAAFEERHRLARARVDEWFKQSGENRSRVLSNRFLRWLLADKRPDSFISQCVQAAWNDNRSAPSSTGALRSQEWRFYLTSVCLSIFDRAMRPSHQSTGPRSRPASQDVLQATYLPFVDCFVTGDRPMLYHLRRVVRFSRKLFPGIHAPVVVQPSSIGSSRTTRS